MSEIVNDPFDHEGAAEAASQPEPQPGISQEPLTADQRGDGDDVEMLGAAQPVDSGQDTQRDPEEWVTGGDPATEAQKTYLDRLAREAGEEIPADVSKAEASQHIDRLQARTGTRPRSD